MKSVIQSVVFEKDAGWDVDKSLAWLVEHKLRHYKWDIPENGDTIRWRQYAPKTLAKRGMTKYSSKKTADGITFIIAFKD